MSGWSIYATGDSGVGSLDVPDDSFAFVDSILNVTRMAIMAGTGNVSIGTSAPGARLHVLDSGISSGTVLRLEDSNSTCNFSAEAGSPTCGSDLRLKKDINELEGSALEKLTAIDVVTYRWKTDDDDAPLQTGFIAQDVQEQFPDLVASSSWIDGESALFLSQNGFIPHMVRAIQEMDLTIKELQSMNITIGDAEGGTLFEAFRNWLADLYHVTIEDGLIRVAQGIFERITTNELCVDDVCVTRDQFQELLNANDITPTGSGEASPTPEQTPDDESNDTEDTDVTDTSDEDTDGADTGAGDGTGPDEGSDGTEGDTGESETPEESPTDESQEETGDSENEDTTTEPESVENTDSTE
jgi:hypothetical protein